VENKPKNRLRRKRLSEELTAQLRKHIIEKGLKPGDPLLTEQEMIEQFGVSHTVVREATKALDFLGIINVAPRRGMVLGHFDFDRVSEYFGFHFALSDYPRDQLLKARVVIETGSLFYTMEKMKQDAGVGERLMQLAEAAPKTRAPKTRAADDPRWIEYDIAFHRGLVEASGIAPLASFCDLLQAFFPRYRPILRGLVGSVEDHIGVVEALRAGKLDKAIGLLRSHMRAYPDDERAGGE
jgi:DNA-binding FadR family transcriptional regulator